MNLGSLVSETRNPQTMDLDALSTLDAAAFMTWDVPDSKLDVMQSSKFLGVIQVERNFC